MRFVIALLLAAVATPAWPQTIQVEIDGASITLALPAGHCPLERSNEADRVLIETVEKIVAASNRVLASFAECGQRAEYRARKRQVLDDYGQYMTPLRGNRVNLAPADFARQMTDVFKQQGAELMQGAEADTRERIGALKLSIRMGETRMLGVLRTDERASYLGIVVGGTTDAGASKTLAGVTAFGAVKGRMLTLNLYSRFTEGPIGAETIIKLLEKSTQTFAATAEANRR